MDNSKIPLNACTDYILIIQVIIKKWETKKIVIFLKKYLNIVKFNIIIILTKDEGELKNGINKEYIF
jgi:hypothetical protein